MVLQKYNTLTIKLYPYKCLNTAMNRQTGHRKVTQAKNQPNETRNNKYFSSLAKVLIWSIITLPCVSVKFLMFGKEFVSNNCYYLQRCFFMLWIGCTHATFQTKLKLRIFENSSQKSFNVHK